MSDHIHDNKQDSEHETSGGPDPVGAVLGRLMEDFAAAAGTVLTGLGMRLGVWDALAEAPGTVASLTARIGVAEPYLREWLRSVPFQSDLRQARAHPWYETVTLLHRSVNMAVTVLQQVLRNAEAPVRNRILLRLHEAIGWTLSHGHNNLHRRFGLLANHRICAKRRCWLRNHVHVCRVTAR